jgi:dTDP-4-dehydrorhamnose 3,5-epimerase-like enzyme
MVYGVSYYWSHDDELGCHWSDPEMRIDWPCTSPKLSRRDQEAGSLSDLIDVLSRESERVGSE